MIIRAIKLDSLFPHIAEMSSIKCLRRLYKSLSENLNSVLGDTSNNTDRSAGSPKAVKDKTQELIL